MTKVLVVDDEPDVLFLLKTILQRAGYEVIEAVHGAAGLERARAESPELILTDLMMPVMDGRELIRRLREDPLIGETPVLLVSAVPDESVGADMVLRKPFGAAELLQAVSDLLQVKSS